jgi:hypothetical protein
MSEKTETRAKSGSSKGFTLSMLAGLLVIPLSAVAAIALVNRPLPEEEGPTTTQSEIQATVGQVEFENLTATPEDLNAACGPAGLSLVALEETATISLLQQAALDALRGLCEQQGMPLPGKPAPPDVTRTVRVNPPAPAAPAPVTETTILAVTETTVVAPTATTAVAGTATTTAATTQATQYTEAKYLEVRARAEAEIANAEAEGGALDKIAEAKRIMQEAAGKAAAGNFHEAAIKCYEAIGKAREALGEDN